LDALVQQTGPARRVGITGVPGVGKSTFIDTLGMYLIGERGENVAVLSVDPSSPISGGSILGDKTRMERLAVEERAFIRPSPAQGHLGGVARRTRETILLCEAAGYRNILVETVGVGQSETAVRSMTDFFLLLMLAGAGDELQGMKRGIIEMLDGMAINKADGDNKRKAERARIEYAGALHLFPASADGWTPRVLTCSSTGGDGIAEVWQMVLDHRELLEEDGHLAALRNRQALLWMNELTMLGLEELFHRNRAVAERLPLLREEVHGGRMTPFAASRELLALFQSQSEIL
jgi:LAO/AO transport system kinase